MKDPLFQWWNKNTDKQLSIRWMRPWWSKNGVGQIWRIRTNGANKKNKDTCLDVHIELGYLVINYTNFRYSDWCK
jgi:hypothetical protein